MEQIVIDALHAAASDNIYPALSRFMKKPNDRELAELDELGTLLDSLTMDDDTRRQIEDKASDVYSSGTEQGFRDGFRLAVRLMLECLEGPETGGQAWNRTT